MTKHLKLKSNELAKKEEYLRQKNLKVEQDNDFWQQKKDKVHTKETKSKSLIKEI